MRIIFTQVQQTRNPAYCKTAVQVAPLKYTKTFIKTLLYNFNNTIVSALNFNILKTNLSKIASKEVKIYVFENYFLKKRSCATATPVSGCYYSAVDIMIFSAKNFKIGI